MFVMFFFFQAEDGIRDLVRSRGLGDVYKRQGPAQFQSHNLTDPLQIPAETHGILLHVHITQFCYEMVRNTALFFKFPYHGNFIS